MADILQDVCAKIRELQAIVAQQEIFDAEKDESQMKEIEELRKQIEDKNQKIHENDLKIYELKNEFEELIINQPEIDELITDLGRTKHKLLKAREQLKLAKTTSLQNKSEYHKIKLVCTINPPKWDATEKIYQDDIDGLNEYIDYIHRNLEKNNIFDFSESDVESYNDSMSSYFSEDEDSLELENTVYDREATCSKYCIQSNLNDQKYNVDKENIYSSDKKSDKTNEHLWNVINPLDPDKNISKTNADGSDEGDENFCKMNQMENLVDEIEITADNDKKVIDGNDNKNVVEVSNTNDMVMPVKLKDALTTIPIKVDGNPKKKKDKMIRNSQAKVKKSFRTIATIGKF